MNYCIINVRDLEMMVKDLENCLAFIYLNNKYDEVEYSMKVYKIIHVLLKELIEEPTEKAFEVVVDFFQRDLWNCFEGKNFKEIYAEVEEAYLAETIFKIMNLEVDNSEYEKLRIVDILNTITETMLDFEW